MHALPAFETLILLIWAFVCSFRFRSTGVRFHLLPSAHPQPSKCTTVLQFCQQYPMQISTLQTYFPEPSQRPTMADTEWPKNFIHYYTQDIKSRRQKNSGLSARRSKFNTLFFHHRQVNYILCMYKWEYNAPNRFRNFKCCTMYNNIAWKLVISYPQPPIEGPYVLYCFWREEFLMVNLENNSQEIIHRTGAIPVLQILLLYMTFNSVHVYF